MRLIRGLYNLKACISDRAGSVVTVGNFDGVHLGHQALIARTLELAREKGLPSLVILFEPQPEEFFSHFHCPPRLTRFREKLMMFKSLGVDLVCVLRFDANLAALSPLEFVQEILVNVCHIKALVVGDDFRFGKNGQGTVGFLKKVCADFGFVCESIEQRTSEALAQDFKVKAQRISSTLVRNALQSSNFSLAKVLLGRPFQMSGRVVHGQKRGRTLGFPTANIFLHRMKTPVSGVFIVEVLGVSKQPWPGIANIGLREKRGQLSPLLEVHLLDFNQMIYGAHVTVLFLKKIRPERQFESFERLQKQVFIDIDSARAYFKKHLGNHDYDPTR